MGGKKHAHEKAQMRDKQKQPKKKALIESWTNKNCFNRPGTQQVSGIVLDRQTQSPIRCSSGLRSCHCEDHSIYFTWLFFKLFSVP